MSIPRQLRNELFKYRKGRKSVDGTVPGIPYTGYSKSRHYVSGTPYIPRGHGNHHDIYNWGAPRDYHPNIHAPAAQSDEYWPDQNFESHMISHPTDPRLFRSYPELPTEESENKP